MRMTGKGKNIRHQDQRKRKRYEMNDFEKIEKLREHADVTFEEAKEALNAANGDLLDAMIYLEKQGKAKSPSQSVYSTKYEDQKSYSSVKDTIHENTAEEESFGKRALRILKKVWRFCTENYFVVRKGGKDVVVLPLLVAIIIIAALFFVSIITLIVLLFFGFSYSFRGKNNMDSVNETMGKAADAASGFAERVKEDISKR